MNLRKRRYHYHNSPKAGMVYCDSSYEIKAALLLDADEEVLFYETQLEFVGEFDKTRYLDFLVHYRNGTKKIIEIKPLRRLPEYEQQIKDNRQHALLNGYEFGIWTENDLGFPDERSATKWADEYLSTLDGVDYTAIRKERALEKVKKHYRKKIATDKVKVYCEYCKCDHEALRLTYDRNIERNGRYICEREGGSISGKRPRKKKENPYAAEGKKQCLGPCGQILLLELFGVDKAKPDGHSSRCMKCRAAKAARKYHERESGQSGGA